MASLFTRIIRGEIPCHQISADARFFAFLDIKPINPGHTVVVPRLEIDRFFDLPDDVLREMLLFARPVARAIEKVVPCQRVGLLVAGLEVPHAHLHLVPITGTGELSFDRAKAASEEELARTAAKIRAQLGP
jgi:histidine triad (HIT) family protein